MESRDIGFDWRQQSTIEFRAMRPDDNGKLKWQVYGVICEHPGQADEKRNQLLGWVCFQERAGEFLFYTDKPVGVSAMLLGYIGSFIFDQNSALMPPEKVQ